MQSSSMPVYAGSGSSSGTLFITARNLLFFGGGLSAPASSSSGGGLLNLVLPAAIGNPDLRVVPLRTVAGICCDNRVFNFCDVNPPSPSFAEAVKAALAAVRCTPFHWVVCQSLNSIALPCVNS